MENGLRPPREVTSQRSSGLRIKEKRIDGLIAHAIYPISTGKPEGFNSKIKVAKRLAYVYRDHSFFFRLIRFLSIPLLNFP